MIKKEKIHIAACLDRGYVMPTGVMMYSACANNPDVDIDFHLVIDESVTTDDKKDLVETIIQFEGKKVLFYQVDSQLSKKYPLTHENRLTHAAYYRIFLPEILPDHICKVIYLDGDCIVRHSLIPLWNTDFSGCAVAVVFDAYEGDRIIYNRLSYPYKKGFFNSGVLLVNLKYWRDYNIVTTCGEFVKHYPEKIMQEDQDVLNVVLQDKILLIPVTYNFQTAFLRKVPRWDYWKYEKEIKKAITDPTIVHFTEGDKPWYKYSHDPHPYRSTFLKYLYLTKWKAFRIERRSKIQILRNYVGDFLRLIRFKTPVPSKYIDIAPID